VICSFSSSSSSSFSIKWVLAPSGELDRRQGHAPDGTYELRVSRRQSAIFHHAALPNSRTRTTTRRSTKRLALHAQQPVDARFLRGLELQTTFDGGCDKRQIVSGQPPADKGDQ
jgi:hypothetical protein